MMTLLATLLLAANPIVTDRFTPDPAPVVDGDTLYVFCGRDAADANKAPNQGFKMSSWQVYKTTDMENWTLVSEVSESLFSWARNPDECWASQAIKNPHNGKWYWYLTVPDKEHAWTGVGVLEADSPEGPWRDPIGHALIPGGFGVIDPTVFIDDDGTPWLFWGNGTCWYAELNKDMISLKDGTWKEVPGLDDPNAFGPLVMKRDWGLGKDVPKSGFEEAPWIYKLGDTYYLEYAAGGVPEHWAYSTAKSIHGPWTYQGKVLDIPEGSFTIHGGSVKYKGDWYMFYHNGKAPDGEGFRRSTCFEKYARNPDGSIPHMEQTPDHTAGALTPAVRMPPNRNVLEYYGKKDMNPILHADVPDMSMIRVGDTYYMSSTTMHYNPGLPIMKSKDLVNWTIASYAYETLADGPKQRLENGEKEYGSGSWASSLRYHDGWFYVSTFSMSGNWKTYVFRTKDPEKTPWERVAVFDPMIHDHSLWFEDGRVFMIGLGDSPRIYELDPVTFKPLDTEGKVLVEHAAQHATGLGDEAFGLRAEGSQVFKHDGWYYLVNICWPGPAGQGRQVIAHRARSIEGPYTEGKVLYNCEGIAQGCFVDTPDGKWYAYLFGDRGGVGRIPYLIPMEWKDGWPVIGGDGKTRPFLDIPGVTKDKIPGIVASDEFNSKTIPLVWQFNHNPVLEYVSYNAARKGWLRLTTDRVVKDIFEAHNTITQRTFGPTSSAVTLLDTTGMKPGDVAGISAFQDLPAIIAIEKKEKGADIVMIGHDGDKPGLREEARVPFKGKRLCLKVACDYTQGGTATCFYSLDGKEFKQLGGPQTTPYRLEHFVGYRFALFNYATKEAGGHADFAYYRISK